jgi:NTE family protein
MDGDLLLYVVDLYARDGDRPHSLEAALERKTDLLFGNQTYIRLKHCLELSRLRRKRNGGEDEPHEKIVLLSYRPGMEEPSPEKSFELSEAAIAQRWRAGILDMESSTDCRPNEEIVFVRRT